MLAKAYMMRLNLCADRWQIRHYKKSHRVLNPSTGNPLSEDHSLLELSVLKSCNKRTMTEQEKYREAFKTLQGVAEQMSHFGTDDFLVNMETLKTLQTQLAAGRRIALKDDAAQQECVSVCTQTDCVLVQESPTVLPHDKDNGNKLHQKKSSKKSSSEGILKNIVVYIMLLAGINITRNIFYERNFTTIIGMLLFSCRVQLMIYCTPLSESDRSNFVMYRITYKYPILSL